MSSSSFRCFAFGVFLCYQLLSNCSTSLMRQQHLYFTDTLPPILCARDGCLPIASGKTGSYDAFRDGCMRERERGALEKSAVVGSGAANPANALLSIDYDAALTSYFFIFFIFLSIFFWGRKNNSVSAFGDFLHHAKKLSRPWAFKWTDTTRAWSVLVSDYVHTRCCPEVGDCQFNNDRIFIVKSRLM